MTFAVVGSPFVEDNTTFSLTPHGVGNLILAEVNVKFQTDVHPTGPSSSNVTWTQIGRPSPALSQGRSPPCTPGS